MGLFSAQSVSALRRPRRGSLSRRWGRVRCCAGSLLSGHLAARVAGAPAMSKEGWDEKDIVSSTWSKEALVYTGEPGVRCSAAEDLRLFQRRARPRAPPRAGTGRWWVRGARRARIARAAPQGASAPARRHVFFSRLFAAAAVPLVRACVRGGAWSGCISPPDNAPVAGRAASPASGGGGCVQSARPRNGTPLCAVRPRPQQRGRCVGDGARPSREQRTGVASPGARRERSRRGGPPSGRGKRERVHKATRRGPVRVLGVPCRAVARRGTLASMAARRQRDGRWRWVSGGGGGCPTEPFRLEPDQASRLACGRAWIF